MAQFKKHIAILGVFILLLPTVVYTIHLFENHKHTVCKSTGEHHFHEQDLDCPLVHYHFNVYTYQTAENYAVIPQHFYRLDYTAQPQLISFVYTEKRSSRAPPYFTV